MKPLPLSYYQHEDIVFLARDLLGKSLMTNIGGQGITGGIITETEAYEGPVDRASHAFGNRHTPRTATMFQQGGIAYIYLCYGIHHLFNVVTNIGGVPHAVLIRGLEPTHGLDVMTRRVNPRGGILKDLRGPGKLTRALGITTQLNATPLTGDTIWIAGNNLQVPYDQISATPRIGVDYAGDHALWPYRFVWCCPPRADAR
ncbi:MAG: DNA-3-methyladenine glycosylase [Bacteroidales bacterium]